MSLAEMLYDRRRIAAAVLLLALLAGFADFAGAMRLSDPLALGSDALMTLTRALVGRDPSAFAQDFLFSTPGNYSFYINASVGFFSLLDALSMRDFAFWYRLLAMPVTAAHLFGWFALGLFLFRRSAIALAFSIACAVSLPVMSGDYWGLFREPQARQLFSAFLPFVLLSGLSAGTSTVRWIVTFALMGTAMWFHPASAPPLALSLMLAMMAMHYDGQNLAKLVACAFLSGLVFLVFAIPNLWAYYSGVRQAGEGADPELVRQALALRFPADYVTPFDGVLSGLDRAFGAWRLPIAVLALASLILQFVQGEWRQSGLFRFLTVLAGMIFFFGGVIPIAEQALEQLSDSTPMQLDLIRSLRYLVPLALIFAFQGLVRFTGYGTRAMGLSVLLAAYWIFAGTQGYTVRQLPNIAPAVRCWARIQAICPQKDDKGVEAAVLWLQDADPGRVFSPDYGLEIRAFARLPLAFDWKDMGWLGYSNHRALTASLPALRVYADIDELEEGDITKAGRWIGFGEKVKADYVVLKDDGKQANHRYDLAFRSGLVSVYKVKPTVPPTP